MSDMENQKEELEKLLSAAEGVKQGTNDIEGVESHGVWLGSSISEKELGIFCRQQRSRMIFVIGMPDAGKTTLLAALYERFLKGPFGDIAFAGSKTLPRFEEISFYARIESERLFPATKRTKFKDDVEFVHLDLEYRKSRERCHFFITDISGEAFESVRNNVEEAQRFSIASQADYMCFIVDAGKLSQYGSRNIAARDINLLVDSFREKGLITPVSRGQIIVSRIDLIPQSNRTEVEYYIESVIDQLRKTFTEISFSSQVFRVAARPSQGPPIALDDLFNSWLQYEMDERFLFPQFIDNRSQDDFGLSYPSKGILR